MASEFTTLLVAYKNGDQDALERLTRMIYAELKVMAQRWTRADGPMSAATLVNETFLKLLSASQIEPADKNEFLAFSARIMRNVIIDEVRRVSAKKRDRVDVTWTDNRVSSEAEVDADFLIQVDDALRGLEERDVRMLRVFECRYFAGYSTDETAQTLGLSPRTVERCWHDAREYLADVLADDEPGP